MLPIPGYRRRMEQLAQGHSMIGSRRKEVRRDAWGWPAAPSSSGGWLRHQLQFRLCSLDDFTEAFGSRSDHAVASAAIDTKHGLAMHSSAALHRLCEYAVDDDDEFIIAVGDRFDDRRSRSCREV